MSIITRRNFIKSSALLGVGLTIDAVSASTQFKDKASENREQSQSSFFVVPDIFCV